MEGMVLLSRTHLTMSRDTSGCHNLEKEGRDYRHLVDGNQDCC